MTSISIGGALHSEAWRVHSFRGAGETACLTMHRGAGGLNHAHHSRARKHAAIRRRRAFYTQSAWRERASPRTRHRCRRPQSRTHRAYPWQALTGPFYLWLPRRQRHWLANRSPRSHGARIAQTLSLFQPDGRGHASRATTDHSAEAVALKLVTGAVAAMVARPVAAAAVAVVAVTASAAQGMAEAEMATVVSWEAAVLVGAVQWTLQPS